MQKYAVKIQNMQKSIFCMFCIYICTHYFADAGQRRGRGHWHGRREIRDSDYNNHESRIPADIGLGLPVRHWQSAD